VPMVLMDALRSVKVTDENGRLHPLVDHERVVLPGRLPDAPAAAPDLRFTFLLTGLVIAALWLRLTRPDASRGFQSAGALFGVLFELASGLGGVVLALAWGCTDHWAMWRNHNLLLLDPLCLLLIPAWWRLQRAQPPRLRTLRSAQLIAALAWLALLLNLTGLPSPQRNLDWIALMAPLHTVGAFVLWRATRRGRLSSGTLAGASP
jgi:hypothetical protein